MHRKIRKTIDVRIRRSSHKEREKKIDKSLVIRINKAKKTLSITTILQWIDTLQTVDKEIFAVNVVLFL